MTIHKIKRSLSGIRNNVSFAQAASGSLQPHQPLSGSIPQKEYILQGNLQSQQSNNRQTPTNATNHLPPQHPQWVEEFKSEIAALVTAQYQSLNKQISSNTEKIEFILLTLFDKQYA